MRPLEERGGTSKISAFSVYSHSIQEYAVIAHDQSYDSVIEYMYARINIEAVLAQAVKHLGYERLSLEQREAIMHFVAGQDASVSIPAGWQVFLLPSLPNCLSFFTRTFDKKRLRTGSTQHIRDER